MKTEIVYGYGFEVEDISEKAFVDFLLNHRNVLISDEEKRFLELSEENRAAAEEEAEEYFEEYECDNSGAEGMYAVISNIMSRETGIMFEWRISNEYECNGCILLVEGMPWQFGDALKDMSKETFDALLKRYMDELGITDEPGNVSVEYYE